MLSAKYVEYKSLLGTSNTFFQRFSRPRYAHTKSFVRAHVCVCVSVHSFWLGVIVKWCIIAAQRSETGVCVFMYVSERTNTACIARIGKFATVSCGRKTPRPDCGYRYIFGLMQRLFLSSSCVEWASDHELKTITRTCTFDWMCFKIYTI